MSSPIKDTPPTFAEQQMLEKQRRYSQLLEDEGSDEIAGCNSRGGRRRSAGQRPPQQHEHARKGQRSAAQRRTRMAVTV